MFTSVFSVPWAQPGGVLFNTFVNETEKYVQYAAIIALLIIVWFMHDSIITPIKTMWRATGCAAAWASSACCSLSCPDYHCFPYAIGTDTFGSSIRHMVIAIVAQR